MSLYDGPKIRVEFTPPEPTTIVLQGLALEAYKAWQADPSWENEEYLTDEIYEQCEHHIAAWTTLRSWDEV